MTISHIAFGIDLLYNTIRIMIFRYEKIGDADPANAGLNKNENVL